ncbi:GNAT family N-acetyltransferase [Nocardia thailandica]|uniref:GNAT family N-acetyltransferase n=1 Tax=Nocardia thailandica TaxID=257275 RepID=A0ABW6PUD3_9NOCA
MGTGNDTRGVLVRAASPEEYDEISELTVKVYVGEGYVPPDDPYVRELADVAHRGAAAEVLVAVHEGAVVGSLTVAPPGNPYAEIAREGELEFRMLAVSAQARGLGAGTALVTAVLEQAVAQGYAAVVLTTSPSMRDARRIYDRFGFVPVPQRDWYTDDGMLLTVLRREL